MKKKLTTTKKNIQKLHFIYKLLIFCLILWLFYIYHYFTNTKIEDWADFGGDTHFYQSFAVNLVSGNGYRYGGRVEYEHYKFKQTAEELKKMPVFNYYDEFYKTGGETVLEIEDINTYRTPGYPIFLAIIYKVFGISPFYAKLAQLVLITFVGAFMTFLGYLYWGRRGIPSGLLSGYLFLSVYAKDLFNNILSEGLTTFLLFILAFLFWLVLSKKNYLYSLILGITMATLLLIKPNTIFFIGLLYLYLLYKTRKKKFCSKQIIFLTIVIISIVAPWSVYASAKTSKPVILSSQLSVALLECNNELTIKAGEWKRQGYRSGNEKMFYFRDDIKHKSTAGKLISFYKEYKEEIPKMIKNKVNRGFTQFGFIQATLLILLIRIGYFIRDRNKGLFWSTYSALLLAYPLTFIMTKISEGVFSNYTSISDFSNSSTLISFFTLSLVIFIIFKERYYNNTIRLPDFALLAFFGYLLLSIIFVGEHRYIKVIDFIFILTTIHYVKEFALRLNINKLWK
jgi:hypothetical protein